MDGNGLPGMARHWLPLTAQAEPNVGPEVTSGWYAERRQDKVNAAVGGHRQQLLRG
jgi:hypothetical protein